MENRQAVTNRLKLVVEFLSRAFEEKRDENEILLLSIALGSVQAVTGAMEKVPHLNAREHLPEIAGDNPCRSPFLELQFANPYGFPVDCLLHCGQVNIQEYSSHIERQ